MATATEPTLLAGTLDLLVLRALAWGPRHGYAVARWIKTTSDDAIAVEDRALYLALHRLEERGAIESEWGLSENNRRAKFYGLTGTGRRELRQTEATFVRYVAGVFKILNATATT
jgi:transcriptional regulator